MKTNEKLLTILISFTMFILGFFTGHYINSNKEISKIGYYDYTTYIIEDAPNNTLSIDFKNKLYFYSENGSESIKGNFKKLDDYTLKLYNGKLENTILLLSQNKIDQAKLINLNNDSIITFKHVNNILTIIS